MAAHDGTLDGRRLNQVLGHVGWSEGRAASLGLELSVYVDALLEQDSLEERVLVAEHQTLISGCAVSSLEVVEVGFMAEDGLFQLLDVLRASLTESSLGLSVSLLAFL
mgnify:FL=1